MAAPALTAGLRAPADRGVEAGPALAVVIVAHDSAEHLPATLAAVRPQLRPGDELVVVDSASRDGSAAVARREAPEALVVRSGINLGFAAGCHTGAAATRAPLLAFLNPDARPAPGCVAALRAAARLRPRWGAWQALVTLPGGEVNVSGGVTHFLGFGWAGGCGQPVDRVPRLPHEVSFASGAALVVRRAAWDAVGGFDSAYFMYGEDLDLGLRLRLAGWEVGTAPAARVEHDYAFDKGERKWFHLERNRWRTVLADYPLALLVLLAPALVVSELALLAIAAQGGWLRPKVRAQRAVLGSLGAILRRRRAVQRARTVSAREFARRLTCELDSPYLGPAARSRVLVALQRAYWRAVLALLSLSARS